MAEIIDGKLVSQALREQIKNDVTTLYNETGIIPGLAVIQVGADPASSVYVRNKHRACLEVGIKSFEINLPEATSEDQLISYIKELNSRDDVHGILVQLPLPKHITESSVIEAISEHKDVDAFKPCNVGRILVGGYDFLPCTPAGVMELLKYYKINVTGKRCVVIGRSNIVGKPMALLLLEQNGTVTVCHSKTKNLSDITRSADIVIVAIGRPEFLDASMVKPGAVVIDVGINRLPNGKLVGDVNFDDVSQIASMITPVPGGVGPMTITMLLKNTLIAALMSHKLP